MLRLVMWPDGAHGDHPAQTYARSVRASRLSDKPLCVGVPKLR
jgi:hypothetical protein